MRIALVSREFLPETSWGGIATHYRTFARGLLELGLDVEVFTQSLDRISTSVENGILVHRIVPRMWAIGPRVGGDLGGNSLKSIGLFSISLSYELCRAFARRHKSRPFDVVDGHEHLGVLYFINGYFRRKLLTVTRYQTPYDSFVTRRMANWPRSRIVRHLEYGALRASNCRIATSRHIDEVVREDFPSIGKADALIPNMTDVAIGSHKHGNINNKENLIIFVGRMMPGHKNPDMAASAFKAIADRFPEWRIEFAGMDVVLDTGGTAWEQCADILRPLVGRYCYHGVLGRDQLAELYSRARILLMPSSIESFGLVAIEAMSKACIPIVADGTALPDVVGEAGMVFPRGSLSGLVAALGSLLSDCGKQEQLAAACLAAADTYHDPAVLASRNVEVFRTMLAAKPLS